MAQIAPKLSILTLPMMLSAFVLALTPHAFADDNARFVLERNGDNGFVRMDLQTGGISICQNQGTELVCRMAADDRVAYEADIMALEERVAALEAGQGSANSPNQNAPSLNTLPGEEEFEKTMDYMERFLFRFKDMVDEFAGNDKAETPPAPMPDKL